MAKQSAEESFEQLYARLEDRVSKLEGGGLSLEEAIALYEEGMGLAKQCQSRLDAAELKITKLKESFAAIPRREHGDGETVEEYEYVSDDVQADEDRPFG